MCEVVAGIAFVALALVMGIGLGEIAYRLRARRRRVGR